MKAEYRIKKTLALLVAICLVISCFTACSSDTDNIVGDNTNASTSLKGNGIDNPTQDYLISCLEATPNIMGIAAVSEENDPNGKLGIENGYYAAIFFSVDLVNQEGIYGDDLIDAGTNAGGCIEAYTTEEAAIARDEYLAKYDNNWLLNSGYHTVIGTLVVRTSKELTEDAQKKLECNIISILTGDEVGEVIPITSSESKDNSTSIEGEESETSSGEIVMPNNTSDYIGSEWTLEMLTKHLKELGFTNIRTVPCEPNEKNYSNNIFEMYIQTGWFSTAPWEAGEKYSSDAEITIYYNEYPILNIENCPDLLTVLTSKNIDYMSFANSYDGRYVEFEAYVTNHITYDGGTSHIIDVTGGDYDGTSELGHYDEEYYNGLVIRIGDRTWGSDVDKSVKEGQNVTVRGKIDASWSEYFKQLYVECQSLSKR